MEKTPYFDEMPRYVTVGGRKVKINSDFRAGIEFERMIMSGERNICRLLSVYYRGRISDAEAYLAAAVTFFRCNEEIREGAGGSVSRVYDFDTDGAAIAASFLACYGIDLSHAKMHWWKFRALLIHLPQDSEFKRIVAVRAADTDGLSPEARRRLNSLKSFYAIGGEKAESLSERDGRWLGYADRRFSERGNDNGK